ncbi:beta-ketoacyl-ACP synthase III [Wukongibacter baidiensis]|uniref:3-oxoacyl-ACP synthase III family protein n=1 Tax=Wukongibacter baidiensis TaxID=1723361 RepID=UPI003D7F49F9
MTKNVKIAGTGYYVPEKIVTNNDLASYLDTSDEWIQSKIGIKERRIADEDMLSSDLGAKAAKMAMKNAGVKAEEIDMIVLATNMPDHISPACAVMVQEKIQASNAFAFDIRVGGCPGILYALSVGSNFITGGTCNTVLVISADMNSRVVDWQDRLTAVILGDGASAMVLKSTDNSDGKLITTQLFTNPEGYYYAYVPGGGMAEPLTAKRLKEGRQFFKMDGREIFKYATTVFPESVTKIVNESNLTLDEIDYVISHQANLNIIKSSMEKLNLPMEKTYCNIDRYANTGGSSVGIAFAEAVEKGIIKKGNKVVLVAFGAGFSWATALLEL